MEPELRSEIMIPLHSTPTWILTLLKLFSPLIKALLNYFPPLSPPNKSIKQKSRLLAKLTTPKLLKINASLPFLEIILTKQLSNFETLS